MQVLFDDTNAKYSSFTDLQVTRYFIAYFQLKGCPKHHELVNVCLQNQKYSFANSYPCIYGVNRWRKWKVWN